jgi:magnesium transporter
MLVDRAAYVAGVRQQADTNQAQLEAVAESGFIWVGVKNPVYEELAALAEEFNLHELQIEDAVKGQQRPKFDDYGDLEFFTLKTLYYEDSSSQVETGDFMIYLGKNFVITIRHGDGGELTEVRNVLESSPEKLAIGPYAVLHAVMDKLIDDYREISLQLENDVSEIERAVFTPNARSYSSELYFLKREIIEFRRGVEPLRPILQKIMVREGISFPDVLMPFFKDLSDHLDIAIDTGNSVDQLTATAIQADLAQLQVQQNSDMRKISAYVALAATPTLVAGIYGMNFENMPELQSAWGYPLTILGMLSVSGLLFRKFKRVGWL